MKGTYTLEDGTTGKINIEKDLASTDIPDSLEQADVFVAVTINGMYFDGFIDRTFSKDER